MKNMSGDANLLRHALLSLVALVTNSSDNKMHATQHGVFLHLRVIQANHKKEPLVIEALCRFLLYFITDKMLVRGTTFKAVVVNEGFAVHLIEMIRDNVQSADVVSWGCRALQHLQSKSSEHKSMLVSGGIIEVLVACMHYHPTHEDALTQATGVILGLSAERALQPLLVRNGCVTLLRDALRGHTSNLKLQEHCIWSMLNICWNDEKCRDAVRKAAVTPYVVEARIRHKNSGSAVIDHKARDLLDKIDPAGVPSLSNYLHN